MPEWWCIIYMPYVHFHKEETTKIDEGPTIACIIFQLCIMVPPNCSNLEAFHAFHLRGVCPCVVKQWTVLICSSTFKGSCSIVYRNYFLGYSTSRQLRNIAKQIEEPTCFKPHIVSILLKSVLRLRISRHTMVIAVICRSLWPKPWSSSGRFTTATMLQHSHIVRFYFWHGVAKWIVTIWLAVSYYTAISMFLGGSITWDSNK